jgi:hypothetical protein
VPTREFHSRRHLVGQCEQVGGIGTGGLQSHLVLAGPCLHYGLHRRPQDAQEGVLPRLLVQAQGEASQLPAVDCFRIERDSSNIETRS